MPTFRYSDFLRRYSGGYFRTLFDADGNKIEPKTVKKEGDPYKDGETTFFEMELKPGTYWLHTFNGSDSSLSRIVVKRWKIDDHEIYTPYVMFIKEHYLEDVLDGRTDHFQLGPKLINNPEVPRPVLGAVFKFYGIKRDVPATPTHTK